MANAATLRAGTAQGLVGEVDQGIHFKCAATHQRRGQHNYIADWITERAGDIWLLLRTRKAQIESEFIRPWPPLMGHGGVQCK